MKKLISLLLALVLLLSAIPMGASAYSIFEFAEIKPNPDTAEAAPYVGITYTNKEINLSQEDYDALQAQYKAHLVYLEELEKAANHDPNKHSFNGYGSNTKYHWMQCACGCRIGETLHIDPKEAPNDTCYCGYRFSDNADLVTLWIKGCPGIKDFDKNKTEYELNAYTYKDVKEIKISTRTHDSEATVELPEDLTLKEGENKFEIKVTSENQKVTKVYTVIINKEAQK